MSRSKTQRLMRHQAEWPSWGHAQTVLEYIAIASRKRRSIDDRSFEDRDVELLLKALTKGPLTGCKAPLEGRY